MMRLLCVLLLSAVTAPVAAQDVLLRFTPPQGQVSVYRVVMGSQMDMSGMGNMTMDMTMITRQTVQGITDSVRTVEVVIDSVAVEGGPAAMAADQMMARMRGMTTTMAMDSRGRVRDVRYADAATREMMGTAQLDFTSPNQLLFPEEAVRPGATWRDSGTTRMETEGGVMALTRDITYRLERLEARAGSRVAVISLSGTIAQEAQGGAMTMRSDGTLDGEIAYDLDASRWVTHDIVVTMLTESPSLPAPMGMTLSARGELTG